MPIGIEKTINTDFEILFFFTKSIDYTNFLKSYYPIAVSYYRNHNIDNSLSDFEYSLKEFPEYEKDPIFLHRYGKALLEKGSSYDSKSANQIYYTDRACEVLKEFSNKVNQEIKDHEEHLKNVQTLKLLEQSEKRFNENLNLINDMRRVILYRYCNR